MLIAIIKDALITVGDYRSLFPNTSFRESGPSAEWMMENNCLPVTTWKAHDKTQKLVAVEPYIEDGQVFTVRVESKPAEELAAEQMAALNQLQQGIVDATQARLDGFAASRGYGGILSACTYATSAVPKFKLEGQYCADVRDATWAKLYEMLEEVKAGKRPIPSGFADVEADLPKLEWPDEAAAA